MQTKGYAGSDCLAASAFLERSLGLTASEVRTAEFYEPAIITQETRS